MKFRNFVLNNFPFLEDDFDALTDYELFCKMIGYMKKMSKQFNDFQAKLDKYENYFNNLNVQDEIDNKLDEMYNDGLFATLVSEFLALQSTYVYDSVADMKLATNLANGCTTKTLGYNNINDGGSGEYIIRTKEESDTADDVFLIDLYDNTLIAELIIKNNMVNVKQSGLTGDSNDDGTDLLTILASSGYDLYFPSGTYTTDSKLVLTCHKLIGENKNNTIIKFTAELNDNFIYYSEVNNIEFNNICFDCGEANDDVKHAINMFDCNDIKITNCEFENGYGSQTRINDCDNVLIENCYFHNATGTIGGMGNAIYCHPSTNIKIINCRCNYIRENFIYLHGEDENPVQNVLIENCYIQNTNYNNNDIVSHAIGINGKCLNVTVINNILVSNGNGIRCDIRNNVIGDSIYISNNIIYNCVLNGIEIQANNVTVENNIIHNCLQDGIYIKNSENININNNNVYSNNRYGIWFNLSNHLTVNSNRIYDNASIGLAFGRQSGQNCEHIVSIGNEIYQSSNGAQVTGLQLGYCNDVRLLSCKSYGQTVDYDIYKSTVTNLVSQLNPAQTTQNIKSIMHGIKPTSGYYNVGDIVFYSTPSAGGYVGAVCVTAGSPGTWKEFGSIES